MMLRFLIIKDVVLIANTYTSLGLHPIKLFYYPRMTWPNIVAVLRGLFRHSESSQKVFQMIDALYRPHYFVFEALWGGTNSD